MVNLIRCSYWLVETQFVARPVPERFVIVDATVKATEDHKIPHHISDMI